MLKEQEKEPEKETEKQEDASGEEVLFTCENVSKGANKQKPCQGTPAEHVGGSFSQAPNIKRAKGGRDISIVS